MEEEGKIENSLEARKELIKLDWKFYFIYFPLFFFNSKFNKKRKDDGITILTGTCNGQLKRKKKLFIKSYYLRIPCLCNCINFSQYPRLRCFYA